MDHQLTLGRARRRVRHDRVDVGVVGGVGVGNEQCFRNQIGHVQFVNDVGQDLSVGAGAFVFFRNSQCNRYNLAKSVKNRQKILQTEENRKQFTVRQRLFFVRDVLPDLNISNIEKKRES